MIRVTLRQYEIFVAVANFGSVTEAAAALGLTQSAASMALSALERQLDQKLFDRIAKRLVLNEYGRLWYPHAIALLERASEAEMFFQREEIRANLRMSASSTVGNYILPQIITRFCEEYPGSRFDLEVSNTDRVIDLIKHFEADIGFVEGPCVDRDVLRLKWKDDELVICCSPSHPLSQKSSISLDDLRNTRWIVREKGSGTREVVERLMETYIGTVDEMVEIGGTEAIKRVLECGFGIACIPRIAISEMLEKRRLVILPVPNLPLVRPLYILIHKDKYKTRGMINFLKIAGFKEGDLILNEIPQPITV
jgi:DNA-binding transcriptional LysR family regulator